MMLMACKFRRSIESNYEMGLLINEGQLIIDKNGDIVDFPIYDYFRQEYIFCLDMSILREFNHEQT